MMRDPKSGSDRNQKAPSSAASQKAKEPTPAFSNVTSTLSDCSPNDRPMSDYSPTDKSSPMRDSVKSVDTALTPDTAKSMSVNVPESKKATSSEETTDESEEEESEASVSARTDEDEKEEEEEQALITKAGAKPKPPPMKATPGVIYWDPKDNLELSDPDTGAITFMKNTVPLIGRRPWGQSRLPGMIIDEGTTSGWPPPDFTPARTETIGPFQFDPLQEYNNMVTGMAETALDWQRIQTVTRDDNPWPYVAFGRINDLDRSLTELANQMVWQAFTMPATEEPSQMVEFEELLLKKTKDFMAEVGKKGAAIGKEFENVAEHYAEIAYLLETVQKITLSDEFNSPSNKHDLQMLKIELQSLCQNMKTRLMELKAQITDYGNFIAKYIKNTKNEKPQLEPRSIDPDEYEAKTHRSANQCVKQMIQEIESDASNDKTGIFKRWYEQSRLRQILQIFSEGADQAVREADAINLAKKLNPPRPFMANGPNRFKQAYFEKLGRMLEQIGADNTDVDDDQLDFYTAPERKLIHLAEMSSIDQKKESKEAKHTSSKFDFYSASEPKSDV